VSDFHDQIEAAADAVRREFAQAVKRVADACATAGYPVADAEIVSGTNVKLRAESGVMLARVWTEWPSIDSGDYIVRVRAEVAAGIAVKL
jgi:hypothetical protein